MRGLPSSPANHIGGSPEGIFILCEFMEPPGPFYLARPNMHTCDRSILTRLLNYLVTIKMDAECFLYQNVLKVGSALSHSLVFSVLSTV